MKIAILTLVLLGTQLCFSQTGRTVKTVTETILVVKGEKEIRKPDSEVTFDRAGNILEEKEYDSEGRMKLHITYEYNERNLVIRQTEFLPDGKIDKVFLYEYDGEGRKQLRTTLNADGEITGKKVYEYTWYE